MCIRDSAEKDVQPVPPERLHRLAEELGGISIDSLTSGAFASEAADDYEAVTGIIRRHPMNQHEIAGFLASRGENDPAPLLRRLEQDPAVEAVDYKGCLLYTSPGPAAPVPYGRYGEPPAGTTGR